MTKPGKGKRALAGFVIGAVLGAAAGAALAFAAAQLLGWTPDILMVAAVSSLGLGVLFALLPDRMLARLLAGLEACLYLTHVP